MALLPIGAPREELAIQRRRVALIAVVVVLAFGSLGIGVAVALNLHSSSPGGVPSGTSDGSTYSYYQSMMGDTAPAP